MTPPTKQELQDALDEFNDLLYMNSNFRDAISLKAVQSIRNALKFTMAANETSDKIKTDPLAGTPDGLVS